MTPSTEHPDDKEENGDKGKEVGIASDDDHETESEEDEDVNMEIMSNEDKEIVIKATVDEKKNPTPSPPPQTFEPPVRCGLDNVFGDQDDLPLTDQIMVIMRQETLRHLEFAWNAQRKLALLCAENDSAPEEE